MDSKTFLTSTNSQDTGDNNIVIRPEQIAAVGVFIGAFVFLVFLSFQATAVYASVRNRKRKRIDQNRRKHLMRVMDQFEARSLDLNGNYNFFPFHIKSLSE